MFQSRRINYIFVGLVALVSVYIVSPSQARFSYISYSPVPTTWVYHDYNYTASNGSTSNNRTYFVEAEHSLPFQQSGTEVDQGATVDYAVYQIPVGDQTKVWIDLVSPRLSLTGNSVQPSPNTIVVDESASIYQYGNWYAVNKLFTNEYEASHSQIKFFAALHLSGYLAPGDSMGVTLHGQVQNYSNVVFGAAPTWSSGYPPGHPYDIPEGNFTIDFYTETPWDWSINYPYLTGSGDFHIGISRRTYYPNTSLATTSISGTVSMSSAEIRHPSAAYGDFDGNGVINSADYVYWRKNDGSPAGYDLWRSHYGQTLGSGSSIDSASIPEPSTLLLLAIGAISLLGCGNAKS